MHGKGTTNRTKIPGRNVGFAVAFCLSLAPAVLRSQTVRIKEIRKDTITMEQTMEFLGSHMKGRCVFKMKSGGKLYVEYLKDGKAYREDVIFVMDLDTGLVKYNKEEKSIVLHCHNEEGECVMRRLYKDKEKKYYSRVNFAFDFTAEEARLAMDAFDHMIRLVQLDGYQRTHAFGETP